VQSREPTYRRSPRRYRVSRRRVFRSSIQPDQTTQISSFSRRWWWQGQWPQNRTASLRKEGSCLIWHTAMLPGFRARGRHPRLTVRSQTTDGKSHLRIGRHKRTCELVSFPKLTGAPFSERAFSWPARVQPVAVCDLSPSVQSGASFCEAQFARHSPIEATFSGSMSAITCRRRSVRMRGPPRVAQLPCQASRRRCGLATSAIRRRVRLSPIQRTPNARWGSSNPMWCPYEARSDIQITMVGPLDPESSDWSLNYLQVDTIFTVAGISWRGSHGPRLRGSSRGGASSLFRRCLG
jgi:hypothetical protein